jgi:uncharacterized repeat protein (TIGR02543 family)
MAVGESGTILTSTDGITWAERNSGVSCYLEGVTYGNGLFVAVGDEGNIVTSPDGISWSQRDTGTDYHLSGIAYGNGVFVVVGYSMWSGTPFSGNACCRTYDFPATNCSKSIILTSHDGISWTENNSSTNLTNCSLAGVTFGDGIFVAVGNGPTLTSSDGITWTESDSLGNFNSVTYLDGTFVVVGNSGVILTSSDGINWTSKSLDTGYSLYGISYGNDTFVTVGGYSIIFTSPDAQNWTNRTLWITQYVTYVNGTFIVIAVGGSSILSSPDGVIWTRKDFGISGSLRGITYGNGTFVAVGDGIILTSTDGVNWTRSSSTFSGQLNSVTYGNNTFVAVGEGIILTSSDGINWTKTDMKAGDWLFGVTYGNGMFVAVGGLNGVNAHGIILTSTDGVNWEISRISGTKGGLTKVTFGKDLFVAVGDSSSIVISNDGLSWTIVTAGNYGDLRAVAYGNETFVATGRSDSILTSTDGINWTKRTAGHYVNLHGLTYGNGTFLAVGEAIIQSDPVAASQYTLTLVKPGIENGTVTSFPAGIDCGSRCIEKYNVGTAVTLVATPSAGSTFTGWSGGCSGIDTTCTITITNGPNFVMANFFMAIPETISTPNTPSAPTNGITGTSYSFSTRGSSSNMSHSIEYRFNWGDGTNSGWLPVSQTSASKSWASAGTYSVKSQARCATDTYAVSGWSSVLSVTISAAETISTPSILSGPTSGFIGISYSYTSGGSTSTLGHDVQYIFDRGDGTNSGWLPVGQTSASESWSFAGTYAVKARARCATHMDVVSFWSGSLSVTITQGYSLTTSVNPQEGGYVSPAGTNWYNSGQTVQVLATANPGYTFTNWSGDFIGTANPTSIAMNGSKNVVANFTQNQYTLTVNIAPTGSGLVTKVPDKTTYVYGDVVTLTATANAGYTFSNWSGDATGSSNPVTVTISGNKNVTANFTQNQYTLTVSITPSGSGSVAKNPDKASYIYGEQVTLTATANSGYIFDKWSGDATGTGNPITLTINENKTVTANFAPITLQSPSDGTTFGACSLYSPPTFSWIPNEPLKGYEIQFSPDNSFSSIPVRVRTTATQVTITSSTWKRVLLTPEGSKGTVYWRVVGTRANRTKFTSEFRSIIIDPAQAVGNPNISSTSKGSPPELSWKNNCNTKFKVWFGSDEQFTKKKTFAFNITNPNDNEGEFMKVLTFGQWMAVRRVVKDTSGSTIYWYVESWDGLKRYNKTDVMSFVLTE